MNAIKKKGGGYIVSAIRTRFSLLQLFIACVILCVGVLSVLFLNATSVQVQTAVRSHVAHLEVMQELRVLVLQIGVIQEETMGVADPTIRMRSLEQTRETVVKAQVLLDALVLGSESESFRASQNGHAQRLWQAYGYSERFSLEPAHQELAAHALVVSERLNSLELHVDLALTEDISAATSSPLSESGFAQSRPSDFVSAGIVPVAEALSVLEEYEVKEVAAAVRHVGETDRTRLTLIALVCLLGITATLFVGLLFSRRSMMGPLRELSVVAKQIAQGDIAKRAPVHQRDEIGQLAEALNILAQKLQTAYADMQQVVKEKTEELTRVLNTIEMKNVDLEKSQMATINLLEDLEEEKQVVEERVRQRTAELEHEKNKLLQVTSNMKGGGILLDEHSEVVFTNENAFSMLHIPTNTPHASVLGHFFAHFEGLEIKEHFKRCIDGETFAVSEIEGHGRVYEIFFHHLKNNEKTSGYFILFFDITDAKLLERSKSELVAVASHQLRTPLTAMRGNVEMLIDESFGALNKEQHELLDDIEVSTIRLITMVNEMLDITKIERGNLEMNIENLNIKEIVSSVVNDLASYAERHNFTISEMLPPDITIAGDKVRVRQIFQNLIDNAIKYSSSPGKLDISATIDGHAVEISFADNGIGVPKNEQPKLFERFYRASNTAKTASSGSGLGLYIVKSIAQQLGGDIRFESEEGVGTTFYVTLPLAHNNK